jgi:alginate O-acetyltransferase complex protein AlgI
MPFHHPAFFLLVITAFAAYWLMAPRFQHAVLLVASLAFYYYAGFVDLVLLLATVAANVWAARRIDASEGKLRRTWVAAAVVLNLSILAYFKYASFIFDNLSSVLPSSWLRAKSDATAVIPLGISFYIFQLISYQIELSKRTVQREPRGWRVLLYILFFPHHQAGPIMRPSKFLPQFYGDKQWNPEQLARGARWILLGLGKKCLADLMAPIVSKYFDLALDGPVEAWQAWRAAIAFGFQIYCDFSGYSDIAVGLGLLFGYELDVNFRQPYLSANPSEFWTRWHITLSQWLRDYLYIPLGGNRSGSTRTYVNLFLTMVLGGLWHGASWMFVLWGVIHGALLCFHRALPRLFSPRPLGIALTFIVVTVAWVPFRAVSVLQMERILSGMAFLSTGPGDTVARWLGQCVWMAAVFGAYWLEKACADRQTTLAGLWVKIAPAFRGVLVAAAIAAVALTLSTQSTYVYFRF